MKSRDLILLLVDKSANAFGELIGLTEEAKLKVALTIIQGTIKTAFRIDSDKLSSKALADILAKDLLDYDQARLLTNLLWTQAEILLKLKQSIASLTNYENALQIIQWQTQHTIERFHLEKQNEITDLNAIIETLKPVSKKQIKIGSLTTIVNSM